METISIRSTDNYRIEEVKETIRQGLCDVLGSVDKPMSSIIKSGDKVFIKPNFVASRWRASCDHTDSLYSVITHPHVIVAVSDLVAEVLGDTGEIIIGDNPSIDADFEELMQFTKLLELTKDRYKCKVSIKDLRPLVCDDLKNYGQKDKMIKHKGDDEGSVVVNLGKDSLFFGSDPTLFRGVFEDRTDTIKSHSGDTQLYTYAKSLYDADVYISIPKMKTHQKVGATLNLKGLVGSIVDKNQLVHWKVGYPEIGGDEYPDKVSYEESKKQLVTHRGAWPGNDTIWRMVCDLYKGLLKKERRYLSIVDGIMGGEGQGPFCPTAKYASTLIVGIDLLYTDIVTSRYMGLDPHKIKYLQYFMEQMDIKDTDSNINVKIDGDKVENYFKSNTLYKNFYVPSQWEICKYKCS